MTKVLLLLIFLTASVKIFSQASDFITVKKRNNKTVKSFFPGVPISLQTYDKRQASGMITAIRNDSIFVQEYDIRQMINYMGIPFLDTVGQYLSGFNYKEIEKVDVSDKIKNPEATIGNILIIGGAGYAALNLINGAYLHEPVTDSKNLTSLGIAAGAVATGFLLKYIGKHKNKYHIEYVHMVDTKKHLRGF